MKGNIKMENDPQNNQNLNKSNEINANTNKLNYYQKRIIIPITINKIMKSEFQFAFNKIGIDLLDPKEIIEKIYLRLSQKDEAKHQNHNFLLPKIEKYVKSFIFFSTNFKLSAVEKTFSIPEQQLKLMIKKQLFKILYLKDNSIEEYKQKKDLQRNNLNIIYNVIKLIEYKYKIHIVGIATYVNQDTEHSLIKKFNWYTRFVDFIITCYLSDNLVTPFSHFYNKLNIGNAIDIFDKENKFDLQFFFKQEKEENFAKKIIYIVENVIYNVVRK